MSRRAHCGLVVLAPTLAAVWLLSGCATSPGGGAPVDQDRQAGQPPEATPPASETKTTPDDDARPAAEPDERLADASQPDEAGAPKPEPAMPAARDETPPPTDPEPTAPETSQPAQPPAEPPAKPVEPPAVQQDEKPAPVERTPAESEPTPPAPAGGQPALPDSDPTPATQDARPGQPDVSAKPEPDKAQPGESSKPAPIKPEPMEKPGAPASATPDESAPMHTGPDGRPLPRGMRRGYLSLEHNPTTLAGRGSPTLDDVQRPCAWLTLDNQPGEMRPGLMQYFIKEPVTKAPTVTIWVVEDLLGELVDVQLSFRKFRDVVPEQKNASPPVDPRWTFMLRVTAPGVIKPGIAYPLCTGGDFFEMKNTNAGEFVNTLPLLTPGKYAIIGYVTGTKAPDKTLVVTYFTVGDPAAAPAE